MTIDALDGDIIAMTITAIHNRVIGKVNGLWVSVPRWDTSKLSLETCLPYTVAKNDPRDIKQYALDCLSPPDENAGNFAMQFFVLTLVQNIRR